MALTAFFCNLKIGSVYDAYCLFVCFQFVLSGLVRISSY